MPVIIILLLILAAGFCFLYLLKTLLVILAAAAVAALTALAVSALTSYLLLLNHSRVFDTLPLSEWAVIGCQGQEYAWTVSQGWIAPQTAGGGIRNVTLLAGGLALVAALATLDRYGALDSSFLMVAISGSVGLPLASCLAAVTVLCGILGWLCPSARQAEFYRSAAATRLKRLNTDCHDSLAAVRQSEEAIAALGESIGAGMDILPEVSLDPVFRAPQPATLLNQAALQAGMAAVQNWALKERSAAEAAVRLYRETVGEFSAAAAEVRAAGSRTFLTQLDLLHDGLYDGGLLSLFAARQWRDFQEIGRAIATDCVTLAEDARRAQGRSGSGNRKSGSNKRSRRSGPGPQQADGAMTPDEAYHIFGIPPGADPDKVKQVYRVLAMAWHVDTSGITDDARMKELNAAYACLKQAGLAR